jgi:Ca2+-binding RTX toxin-like protein
VDLASTEAQDTRGAGTDTLTGVENLAGSAGDDILAGDSGQNVLSGGGGSDTLRGMGGADTYRFDPDSWGDETIDEDGSDSDSNLTLDRLDFSDITDDLTFVIHTDGSVSISSATRSLARIQDVEYLIGGGGENTFVFEVGASFEGTIDGGAGALNTLDYSQWTTSVNVDLTVTDGSSLGQAQGTEGVRNIHKVIGGMGADTLTGDDNDNILIGGAGDDSLSGGVGDDELRGDAGDDILDGGSGGDLLAGGLGDDVLNGGEGSDTASYAGAADGVSVNLNRTGAQETGGGGSDTLEGIENLIGTDRRDVLTGNAEDNLLRGGEGDDDLYGGAGNDLLAGGLGRDLLSGGEGSDTVSYDDITNPGNLGVEVDLSLTVEQETVGAGRDTLLGIRHIIGSRYDDLLTGDGHDNVLLGGEGSDELYGGGGADVLSGGQGSDTIHGGAGDDLIEGGEGDDTLEGGEGDDLLQGGTGDDVIRGGAGTNTVSYADADTGVTVSATVAAQQQVIQGTEKDTLENIGNIIGSIHDDLLTGDGQENIIVGGGGDDVLIGGGGDDILLGDTGDDTLIGDAGDDHLVGGGGTDTLSYEYDPDSVDVDLRVSAVDGHGDTDTFSEIEIVRGSSGDDTL